MQNHYEGEGVENDKIIPRMCTYSRPVTNVSVPVVGDVISCQSWVSAPVVHMHVCNRQMYADHPGEESWGGTLS